MSRNNNVKVALRKLKAYCDKNNVRLHSYLSRFDNQQSGAISRESFINAMRSGYLESPNDINVLANFYRNKYTDRVDYNLLVRELNTLSDSNAEASLEVVRVVIDGSRLQSKKLIKEIFDSHSVNKRMDVDRLQALIRQCGYTSFSTEDCENFIRTLNPNSASKFLNFYQFLSVWDRPTIVYELGLIFRSFRQPVHEFEEDLGFRRAYYSQEVL